jgi:hypothetical protein
MLAQRQNIDISDYASDRVFDGKRPISVSRLAKLRANYQRQHLAPVYRLVYQVTRLFGFRAARH